MSSKRYQPSKIMRKRSRHVSMLCKDPWIFTRKTLVSHCTFRGAQFTVQSDEIFSLSHNGKNKSKVNREHEEDICDTNNMTSHSCPTHSLSPCMRSQVDAYACAHTYTQRRMPTTDISTDFQCSDDLVHMHISCTLTYTHSHTGCSKRRVSAYFLRGS